MNVVCLCISLLNPVLLFEAPLLSSWLFLLFLIFIYLFIFYFFAFGSLFVARLFYVLSNGILYRLNRAFA